MMGCSITTYSGRLGFMTQRRRVFPLLTLVVVASSIAVLAQAPPNKDDKKKSDAQNKEIQNIVKIVDGIAAGQPAPTDWALTWGPEAGLRPQGNKEHAPLPVPAATRKVTASTGPSNGRVVTKNGA